MNVTVKYGKQDSSFYAVPSRCRAVTTACKYSCSDVRQKNLTGTGCTGPATRTQTKVEHVVIRPSVLTRIRSCNTDNKYVDPMPHPRQASSIVRPRSVELRIRSLFATITENRRIQRVGVATQPRSRSGINPLTPTVTTWVQL